MRICVCRSRVHAWALNHTLEVYFDNKKMSTFNLRQSMWAAGAMDESRPEVNQLFLSETSEEDREEGNAQAGEVAGRAISSMNVKRRRRGRELAIGVDRVTSGSDLQAPCQCLYEQVQAVIW